MEVKNIKKDENITKNETKIYIGPQAKINFNLIKVKFKKNELKIEEVLMSDECINDLKMNIRSKFKKIITTSNTIKLISFCLNPNVYKDYDSNGVLRYPYYSCELLCSPCILNFKKSIKSIKEANEFENAIKKLEEKEEAEEDEINSVSSIEEENEENIGDQEIKEKIEQSGLSSLINEEDIQNEKFMDYKKYQGSLSEIQMDAMESDKNNAFEKEEIDIINEIFEEIFKFLNLNLSERETYVGYFQKIVNYLMTNEPKITIEYLFDKKNNIINGFYRHMNNESIHNILENILNYLSDREHNDKGPFQFNIIILDLLKEIESISNKKYNMNKNNSYYDDKNKIDFICELIINTLVYNSSKNFIQLILPSSNDNNDFMRKIKSLIENAVDMEFNEDNHKKNMIINLLEILLQINSIIMYSKKFNNNFFSNDMTFFDDYYKKIRIFEYQYICKKSINYDKIFEAFEENNKLNNSYLSIIKDIYGLIINDIKNNYNNNKETSLMFLYEWKYILSSLKLFIFQFYAFKNFDIIDGTNDFYDKELFDLSIKLYFQSNTNNIYQNIFIDIIKLINYEKTPKYLINDFIEKQHLFIDNIKKIVNEDNKYSILLGLDIQILLLFYNSLNPAVVEFHNELKKNNNLSHSNNLDIFDKLMIFIKPNFERQLKENYIFTELEIFDLNNSRDTFDGNDIENAKEMKFDSLKTTIKNYIENLNFFQLFSNNNKLKMSNSINSDNSLPNINNSNQQVETITNTQIIAPNITYSQIDTQTINQSGSHPFIERKIEFNA